MTGQRALVRRQQGLNMDLALHGNGVRTRVIWTCDLVL